MGIKLRIITLVIAAGYFAAHAEPLDFVATFSTSDYASEIVAMHGAEAHVWDYGHSLNVGVKVGDSVLIQPVSGPGKARGESDGANVDQSYPLMVFLEKSKVTVGALDIGNNTDLIACSQGFITNENGKRFDLVSFDGQSRNSLLSLADSANVVLFKGSKGNRVGEVPFPTADAVQHLHMIPYSYDPQKGWLLLGLENRHTAGPGMIRSMILVNLKHRLAYVIDSGVQTMFNVIARGRIQQDKILYTRYFPECACHAVILLDPFTDNADTLVREEHEIIGPMIQAGSLVYGDARGFNDRVISMDLQSKEKTVLFPNGWLKQTFGSELSIRSLQPAVH